MSEMSAAHNSSHRDRVGIEVPFFHADTSLEEPAVIASVPMAAWCKAIFSADGWNPCE